MCICETWYFVYHVSCSRVEAWDTRLDLFESCVSSVKLPLSRTVVTSSKVPICHALGRIDLFTSLLIVGLLPFRGSWSVFQGHPISQRDSDESFHLRHPVHDRSQSWQTRMTQSDMLATSSGWVCLPSTPSLGKASWSLPVCSVWGKAHGLINQPKPG